MSAVMFLAVVGGVVAAAVGLWLLRAQRAKEDVVYTVRCPGCTQKVRYPLRRAGRMAKCARCGARWQLPANPSAAAAETASEKVAVGRRILARHSRS